MKRNCNLEEKLEAIALVEQGETPRSVANKLHLGHHILYEWLELYRKEGISGLKEKNCEHKKHYWCPIKKLSRANRKGGQTFRQVPKDL